MLLSVVPVHEAYSILGHEAYSILGYLKAPRFCCNGECSGIAGALIGELGKTQFLADFWGDSSHSSRKVA